jgi:ankyrin repeat protein
MGSYRGALAGNTGRSGVSRPMKRREMLASLVAGALAGAGVWVAPAVAQIEPYTLKPLVKAVRDGDDDKVRQALLKGENPNQTDQSKPLVMVATLGGSLPVVESLLKAGAVVDATDGEGYTSLIRAAERGDADIVELLLKRNARPNAQTRQGVSALMMAARAGNAEIVRLLLDKKADPNLADFTGRSAMIYARQAGRASIEPMLRKAGGRG